MIKMPMKKYITFILSGFLMVSACTPTTVNRGNFLHQDDIAAIQPFTSNKNDVLNILGTPTAKAVFDENTWYYVGLTTEKKSFMDEKVTGRQTVKISFSDTDFVDTIALVENDPVDVPTNNRITPTSGNEVTALQQILGNIGKFNPPEQGNPGL
jgi:outer membrane protein assembly factor BamE (lipoprotein component of BamABCDE complex)